jgi:hypothetical protein
MEGWRGAGECEKRQKIIWEKRQKKGKKDAARLAMLSSYPCIVGSHGAPRLSLPLLPAHGSSHGMEMRFWSGDLCRVVGTFAGCLVFVFLVPIFFLSAVHTRSFLVRKLSQALPFYAKTLPALSACLVLLLPKDATDRTTRCIAVVSAFY